MKWFNIHRQKEILFFIIGMLVMTISARAMFEEPRVEYVEVEVEVPVYMEAENPIAELCGYRNPDAEEVARVLYGVCDYNLSNDAKTAIIEVIMNRANCTWGEFGNTVSEVCSKDSQWQGYVADGNYLESDYELALNVLNNKSGARTVPNNCLFLRCEYGKVAVRQQWDSNNEWVVE